MMRLKHTQLNFNFSLPQLGIKKITLYENLVLRQKFSMMVNKRPTKLCSRIRFLELRTSIFYTKYIILKTTINQKSYTQECKLIQIWIHRDVPIYKIITLQVLKTTFYCVKARSFKKTLKWSQVHTTQNLMF